MNRIGYATAVVGGFAAAIIGMAAPAAAAPSGSDNAVQTIGQLRSQGYTVIVNRLGNTPLDRAEVVAVRQGQTYTHINAGQAVYGSNTNYSTVEDNIVYVDVK
ncbi:hypothetical protein [Mycolicibacterium gadium]|uniref:hypothetical protein n=1 Tax=Mycolicibacterium gadium TaxID=1794 RepID=UPI002FDCDCFF